MNWEEIQSRLRRQLSQLFPREESIRTIVRDVDTTIEEVVTWHGSVRDFWSEILRAVRVRHLELKLIEATLAEYPQDEILKQAKADFQMLTTVSPPNAPRPPDNRQTNSTGPIQVFISYAQKDEKFKDDLETHLALLRREKIISTWYGQQAQLGLIQGWEQEIAEHIDSAQIVLLLMSPSFIASDQLYENEMTRAIERQKANDPVRVIPIAVRHIAPSDPDKTPDFQKIQGLPRNGKPIEAWRSADEAWAQIAQEIRLVCKDLRASAGKS